jgi:polysaccharide biosynthesis/export protein
MNRRPAVSVFLLLLCSSTVYAQNVDVNQRITQLSSLGKMNSEYRLGPGDLIEIGVFGVDNFRHTLRISASGIVKLPLVEPITASGLTAAELEQKLAALLDGEVIRNPQVSVFVKEYRSQPVLILGAVKNPGQYQITLQLNIVDILAMAGGLLPNAGDEAVVQRRTSETGPNDHAEAGSDGHDVIKVNLRELLEKGDMSLNIPVRGGDVVHIQERLVQVVYVIGEVNRAGVYQLPPKQDLRVSQAFAWAGGPMKTAKMGDGILVRYEKGVRHEIPVNFSDILKGKREDFLVHADDIIFVPGSEFKNIGYGLLGLVPGAAAQIPLIAIRGY